MFTKPNDPAAGVNPATYAGQAQPDKVDWDIIVAGPSGTGVVSGCAVTAHGSGTMAVDVASGVITVAGGAQVTVTAVANLAVTTGNATNPRIDLIVVDSSGTVSVVTGTAAAVACMPNVPAISAALAEVYVPATQASVIAGMLRDLRVVPSASYAPGVTLARAELGGSTVGTTSSQTLVNSTGAAAAPVSGLSCSVTPPAGVDLEISVELPFVTKDATANYVQVQIWEDGVIVALEATWIAASGTSSPRAFVRCTPSAGVAHTYTATAHTPNVGGGTATLSYGTSIVNTLTVKAA